MTNTPIPDPHRATLSDLEDRVLKVIATTKRLPRDAVSPDASFESLGIDSLDRLNILFDLESEFDIQINDEDAKRVETIRQMVAGVALLVNGESPAAALARTGDLPTAAQQPDGAIPAAAESASPIVSQTSAQTSTQTSSRATARASAPTGTQTSAPTAGSTPSTKPASSGS